MFTKLASVVLLLGLARSAPTTYDQRQEGELNVKVDLDNFVILVARPTSSSSSSGLDLLGSIGQLLADGKLAQEEGSPKNEDDEEMAKSDLEDVSLESKPEVLVLVEDGDKLARTMKTLKHRSKEHKLKSKYKFVDSVDEPKNWRLIGDMIENCGPGRSRDRLGICQSDDSASLKP